MESLSDLDECINNLENLQLTIDFESSTVKRNPKAVPPLEYNYYYSKTLDNRLDLVRSNQHNYYQDHRLPDITKSLVVYPSENSSTVNDDDQNTSPSFSDTTDFKSLSIRRPKLTSNLSVDNDLFSVPEFEVSEFPPPPPIININTENYIKKCQSINSSYQHSSNNSSPSGMGNTSFHPSSRNQSVNSLKLSPKVLLEPFFSSQNNNINSANSSQSNLSTQIDSKNTKEIEPMSENFDPSQQTVVRFFSSDKTTKALVISKKMTVEIIINILMEKNLWLPPMNSYVVEKVPSLKMERFLEEHEYLLDCVNSWPATCSNMIFFEQREDIYGLFENARTYLGDNYPNGAMNADAIKTLFYNLTTNQHEYQDYIYIKKTSENNWKRKFCLLNHKGISTIHKKKSKTSKNQPNITSFNENHFLYTTTGGWTKEFDAPTPFGFAFKPYSVLNPKSDQLLMFCASDEISMKRWCSNLRLCKYKNQILNNYQQLQSRSTHCGNLYSSVHHINRGVSLSSTVFKTSNSDICPRYS